MWRHDDDQLCLATLVFSAAEQGAEHRNVANPWHLAVQIPEIILQQSGNGKAFAVPHLNRCFSFAP